MLGLDYGVLYYRHTYGATKGQNKTLSKNIWIREVLQRLAIFNKWLFNFFVFVLKKLKTNNIIEKYLANNGMFKYKSYLSLWKMLKI